MKKYLSLIMAVVICCMLTLSFEIPVMAVNECDILSISPQDGSRIEKVTDDVLNFRASTTGAVKAVFLLDGNNIAEFTESTEECTFEYPLNDLEIGVHSFTVIAYDNMGNSFSKSSSFKIYLYKLSSINPGVSTDPETFNALGDEFSERTSDSIAFQSLSENFGFDVDGTDVFLQRIKGASGMPGDYGIRIVSYGTSNNATVSATFNRWTEEVTSGKIVCEYDMVFNPSKQGQLCMFGLPFDDFGILTPENNDCIKNTNFVIPSNEAWFHMCFEYDVDNNKISLKINGKKYWDEVNCASKSYKNNLKQIRFEPGFWSAANYFLKNYWAYMALDNFRIYQKKDILEVTEMGYSDIDGKHSDTNEVSCSCNEVYTDFSMQLSKELSADDISLYINGKETQSDSIDINKNKIRVALPEGITPGSDIVIKTNSDAAESVYLYYKMKQSVSADISILKNAVNSQSQMTVSTGDKISAKYSLTNNTGEEESAILVFVIKENNRPACLKIKKVSVNAKATDSFSIEYESITDIQNATVDAYAIKSFDKNIIY